MTERTRQLVINFKTYEESTGKNAVKLARAVEAAATKSKSRINAVIVPTALDLCACLAVCKKAKVFGQHADPVAPGKSTGWLTVENFKAARAAGLLINHAEHQLPHEKIAETIGRCRKLGLASLVCAKDESEAAAIAKFAPDMISIEPPELIGSGISVSTAKPEVVTRGVHAVHQVSPDIPVLCGAGISGKDDVEKALYLGARGVLLASFITLAKNPEKAAEEIVAGFD